MDRPPKSIGAYEAKTRLSELLRDAQAGATYVIRRRGKTVAQLVPPPRCDDPARFAGLKASIRDFRAKVRGKFDVRAMIREGRRP